MSRYQELAATTEKLIADGLLRPGDRLPSIRQACRTHGLSPITVSSAYQVLESRGRGSAGNRAESSKKSVS